MKNNFLDEIKRFKEWSHNDEVDKDFSEWETTYPYWENIYNVVNLFIEDNGEIFDSNEEVNNLIYIIARDNESQIITQALLKKPKLFLSLIYYVLESDEINAKIQVAFFLGDIKIERNKVEAYLLKLVENKDEYINRLALHSLGKINSKHVEKYCRIAWDSNIEHQRMMVLMVLNEVKSSQLSTYMEKVKDDGREHLVSYCNELK